MHPAREWHLRVDVLSLSGDRLHHPYFADTSGVSKNRNLRTVSWSADGRQLQYAAKDARDFAEAMLAQRAGLYREVLVKILTDAQATRDEVVDGRDWLQREVTAKDVAMVFLAGHGVNDAVGNYYYLPVNAEADSLIVEGAERLVHRRLGVGMVELVEVDVVSAEPPERSLDGVENVLVRASLPGIGTADTWASPCPRKDGAGRSTAKSRADDQPPRIPTVGLPASWSREPVTAVLPRRIALMAARPVRDSFPHRRPFRASVWQRRW